MDIIIFRAISEGAHTRIVFEADFEEAFSTKTFVTALGAAMFPAATNLRIEQVDELTWIFSRS